MPELKYQQDETKIFQEEFNPDEYLRMNCGELPRDPEIIRVIFQSIINTERIISIEREENKRSTIDLTELEKNIALTRGKSDKQIAEWVEDYCMFDFTIRRAIPRILKEKPEDHLKIIDVGGGPTIYQHIPLMGFAESITHGEFLPANRQSVENWKDGKSSFDWSSYFRYIQIYLALCQNAILPNSPKSTERLKAIIGSKDIKYLENVLKEKLKAIIPVNVFSQDLGLPLEENYDLANVSKTGGIQLLTSNFCIESATSNPKLWEEGVKHIASRIRDNGFLLMTAIKNANWYRVSNQKMPATPVNFNSLIPELLKNGLKILETLEIEGLSKEIYGYDGDVLVLAKKTKEENENRD